ncbi:homocitrate synthase/isopropylmalate synthase family protein [Clostridium thailandense]|nr:hypothetical protein [Clostridium thailandense]
MIELIDQTVDEGLNLGLAAQNIKSTLQIIKKYSVETVEISLCNLEKSSIDFPRDTIKNLLRCKVNASAQEIVKAKQIGFSKITVNWSHSYEESSLLNLKNVLCEAKNAFQEVYIYIQNASSFTLEELSCYFEIILSYKIKGFIYGDEDSSLEPLKVYTNMKTLKRLIPCMLEFHGHNGYGLATANSLAALKAGIVNVSTSVSGIGFHGHAAMEEVLMAAKHLWKWYQVPSGKSIAPDFAKLLAYMGISLPGDKAIIGNNVFAHESGIHVDGVFKNSLLYEVIKPEEVGLTRKLVIGKHSGIASVKAKFLQWNINLDEEKAVEMLNNIKEIAVAQKGALSDEQLHKLYAS